MKFYDDCKLILAVFILLAISFLIFSNGNCEEYIEMYIDVKEGSSVNVREFSNADSNLVCRLNRGDSVKVTKFEDDFYYAMLVFENKGGWIYKDYVSQSKPDIKCTGKYIVNAENVAVRKNASKDSKVLFRKKIDSIVTVFSWIECDGVVWAALNGGYMMSEFLTEVE